jgi:DNA adenine methylase
MVTELQTSKPTRPVLRYHGGKWLLAPWIVSHFPEHRYYREPFGGAASVLLHKSRCYHEVYNELDGEVVNLFRVLRDPPRGRELKRALELTPFARTEFELSYLPDGDPVEQARRTMVRSFMGFSTAGASGRPTGFRSGCRNSGTAPATDWHGFPAALDFFIERMRGVVIDTLPAVEVLARYDDPRALFYEDPPYPSGTRDAGRDYNHEMSDDDHRALAEANRKAQGMIIISGYACELYDRELYSDWHRVERKTFADGARKRTEVLWLNEAAASRVSRTPLFDTPECGTSI